MPKAGLAFEVVVLLKVVPAFEAQASRAVLEGEAQASGAVLVVEAQASGAVLVVFRQSVVQVSEAATALGYEELEMQDPFASEAAKSHEEAEVAFEAMVSGLAKGELSEEAEMLHEARVT